ncbi:MAG: DAK2 domain-containing protein [Erysipelotrichaceae bacterium]|nr:DAK2 domain-containing protein [Erysipelotrichaceae bacterium]
MKIINGQDLKKMFISGANNLYNFYPEIDALNVFPVPDGDTGMNMNLTMTSGSKEIQNRGDENIAEIAKAFSRGLLMGARGNSGVITSQIFRGFAQGLEGKKEINAVEFSHALDKGVEVAYKAVVRPVEGTILTVMRESSEVLSKTVKKDFSIEKAMDVLIKEAKESLKRTPELLPILKEVGVIDSGGAGLLKIFEGIRSALDGKVIERNEATSVNPETPIRIAGASMEDEEFGYCTEFIMSLGPNSVKKPFNEKRFTTILGSHGNSLVVVHDEDIVKVHVHTLNPGEILTYAQQFGEFLKLKIENMTEQHHALATGATVENHEDLVPAPEEAPKEKTKYAMIAVSSGDGIDEFFREIGISIIVKGGQTMNPSSEDFVTAIHKANAENVYIFPNNSNIVMAASQACDVIAEENINVYVIPSKTIPQGITSAIMFNEEATPEENFREMKSALKNVKSGEVTFATRDTKFNGIQVKKDDFIGIFEKDIVIDTPSKIGAVKYLIDQMIDDESSIITIILGEDVSEKESHELKSYVEDKYPEIDIDIHDGQQPVYSFLIGIE